MKKVAVIAAVLALGALSQAQAAPSEGTWLQPATSKFWSAGTLPQLSSGADLDVHLQADVALHRKMTTSSSVADAGCLPRAAVAFHQEEK